MKKSFLFILCMFSVYVNCVAIKVDKLTCENICNPLGIDIQQPKLGWTLSSDQKGTSQSAYEIMVGTDKEGLLNGKGLIWKSGKVKGDKSINIAYAGKKLKSYTRYFWVVRSYDENGIASKWSDVAWWETSMMDQTDWTAKWIDDGSVSPTKDEDFYKDDPVPVFRKEFVTGKNIRSARLYISGLGYYEASLNGKRIGDHILDPGWTNFTKQVLYSTYDVTDMIKIGHNCIGVMLGNGFYNPLPMRIFKPLREFLRVGRPCLKAQLRIVYDNGEIETVCTDETWKTTLGPIIKNNVYLGELYNANKEIKGWNEPKFNDADWNKAFLTEIPPEGILTVQMQPPIRVREIIEPIRMTECRLGEFVFDMGQNFAGVVQIKVKGPKGTRIRIRYGEDVYSDGSLNIMTSVSGQNKKVWGADQTAPGCPPITWQEDSYILKGEGEEIWSPRFTFHGFRYVEITGWPGRPTMDDIRGIRFCSDLEQIGTFESSNELLNKLFKAIDYTFLSNVQSVQSDCPAREKFGYGGDIVGVSPTFCYFYDMSNFYKKTIRDFANDQRPSGGFTETAPYNGIADSGLGDHSGPIGWQLAFAFLQKQLYDYYGDQQIIGNYYFALKKQMDFLTSASKDFMIDRCINDHESLDPRIPALFATAHFYHHAILITEFAHIIGENDDREKYERLAKNIKKTFISKFVDSSGKIGNGTPSEQAFALFYNLIPESMDSRLVLNKLIEAIELRDNHISSGIFGTPIVLAMLSKYGRNDIAYKMVNQKTFPGWGYMIEKGATTIWETWKYSDNVYSQNHPMFGSVGEWMFSALGGIISVSPGFKTFKIKPYPADGLDWVKCNYKSKYGMIKSEWKQDKNSFHINVSIPVNTTAKIYLPGLKTAKVLENNQEVKVIGYEKGYHIVDVPSGNYHFSVTSI